MFDGLQSDGLKSDGLQSDPSAPVSMGAMPGPEAFSEVRYLAHHKQLQRRRVAVHLPCFLAGIRMLDTTDWVLTRTGS